MSELDAYHEAGHACVAAILGGRVVRVAIDPEHDDGPRRSGETEVRWSRRLSTREVSERIVQVALAGPVAEMLYSGDPYHPGLVAEWSQDWQTAWEFGQHVFPNERLLLDGLEQLTRRLYSQLDAEPQWSTIAAVADHLLAYESMEWPEVRELIQEWMGR